MSDTFLKEAGLSDQALQALQREYEEIRRSPETPAPEVQQEGDSEETLHQVDARTGYKAIWSIDETGKVTQIGRVRTTDYEGSREVRGVWLDSTISGKTHSLGAASKMFQIFDHYAVAQPLMEAGFVPQKIMHARGGASFMGVFNFPEKTWEDPISWDLKRFAVPTQGPLGKISLALRVRSDLRRGHGVALTMGYFRLVCLNGLTVKILDLGSFNVDHRNWSEAKLDGFLKTHAVMEPSKLPTAPTELLEGVAALVALEDPKAVRELPRLVREPTHKLYSELNHSTRPDLADQLNLIRKNQETFTVLDLTNAWTNLTTTSRTSWGIYDEADPAVKALRDLVELEGVRQGVKTFEFGSN